MNYLEKINIEYENDKTIEFKCLIIKKCSISHLSYGDLDYVNQLLSLNLCEETRFTSDTFTQIITEKLDLSKYNQECLFAKNETLAEEPNYTYEMIYIDFDKKSDYIKDENINELSTLINISGEKIYSTAILFKKY